jgi:hypothetical protein
MRVRILCLALGAVLAAGAFACREEGAAEKAGRKIDEAVDNVRNAGDGALEDLGEKADDAIDDAKDAVDDLHDKATAEE